MVTLKGLGVTYRPVLQLCMYISYKIGKFVLAQSKFVQHGKSLASYYFLNMICGSSKIKQIVC